MFQWLKWFSLKLQEKELFLVKEEKSQKLTDKADLWKTDLRRKKRNSAHVLLLLWICWSWWSDDSVRCWDISVCVSDSEKNFSVSHGINLNSESSARLTLGSQLFLDQEWKILVELEKCQTGIKSDSYPLCHDTIHHPFLIHWEQRAACFKVLSPNTGPETPGLYPHS